MQEIEVYSLMRSGHHAICNWIYKQFEGKVVYANDVDSKIWNPDQTDNRIDQVMSHFQQGKCMINGLENVRCSTIHKCTHYPLIGKGFDPKTTNISDVDYLIYAIEDDPFVTFRNGVLTRSVPLTFKPQNNHKKIGIGNSSSKIQVLIIRDVFNLIASRIEYQKRTKFNVLEDVPYAWKSHAYEFLRITQSLNNPILVNYNSWVKSKHYRKELADSFGFKFTDDGYLEIPQFGGGSSFKHCDINSDRCKRYFKYLNNSQFYDILDDEMKDLNHKIFDLILPKIIL